MTKVYPAIIHNDHDGLWLDFPDLPGCSTMGDDICELMTNAEEALGTFLAVKMELNEKIPEASDIKSLPNTANDEKTYISVDVNKYHRDTKSVKKMLSIPAWLAKESEQRNLSLSKILQEALIAKINMT